MSKRPQKRLVNGNQYRKSLLTRARLLFGTCFFSLWSLMCFSATLWSINHGSDLRYSGGWWFDVAFRFAWGAWSARVAYYAFRESRKIERVRLVTKRTSHLLSPEDSLVRASDLPPTQPQTELLRAAQYGKETPAEQLLRAGQESRENV